MKSIIKSISSILRVRSLIPCLFLMALVGCNGDMWDGYQLPPPLPAAAEPEPEPDPDYEDHPSLLTTAEATRLET